MKTLCFDDFIDINKMMSIIKFKYQTAVCCFDIYNAEYNAALVEICDTIGIAIDRKEKVAYIGNDKGKIIISDSVKCDGNVNKLLEVYVPSPLPPNRDCYEELTDSIAN